ncbi:DUF4300 family protein [Streptococcus suis]|nr:DUF4300 family protein [Streptococcus suis]
MKKILALMLTSFLVLAGCQTTLSSEPQVSNLVDKSSLTEVKKRLEATLPEEDVNQFLSYVTDYNDTIQEGGLMTEQDLAIFNYLYCAIPT